MNLESQKIYSWGRIRPAQPAKVVHAISPTTKVFRANDELGEQISMKQIKSDEKNPLATTANSSSIITFGNGRSYGDTAYNDDGIMILNYNLNKFIHFDRKQGLLTAESGVLLADILELIIPCGWFLPVTPGTKFVTLAGALANDVHGKNHHCRGSFGVFVDEFELVRSNGEVLICSRDLNSNMFFATVGGLGLTGWITKVTIRLISVQNPFIITNSFKFSNLAEYFQLNQVLESKNTYTVAWIDCLASGKNIGRGIYYTGEHAGWYNPQQVKWRQLNKKARNFVITPTCSLVNKLSLKLFNSLYYKQVTYPLESKLDYYDKFFYPLDKSNNWNLMYGKKGFYQYQCVVPVDNALEVITEILKCISHNQEGSFLAVLKTFGSIDSGGLLSFPRKGVTLALDFANKGDKTLKLFAKLDAIVKSANGALYPAKDGRMGAEMFKLSMPRLEEFTKFIDPKFSSNFWRRVGQ